MRSCIMPGLPTHLLQELNVGTVLEALLLLSAVRHGDMLSTLYTYVVELAIENEGCNNGASPQLQL